MVELNTFHEGDIIYAGPINDSFTALKERELGSLTDVYTSGMADGNVLQFDGTDWVPSRFSPSGVWALSGSIIYTCRRSGTVFHLNGSWNDNNSSQTFDLSNGTQNIFTITQDGK